jgi:hypothetical protein
MKNKIGINFWIIVIGLTIAFASCSKGEGKGGGATIQGKILRQDYVTGTIKDGAEYPGADERVYLIYGNGTVYSEDFDASYDGSYEFKNLRTGNYKVFVYSDIVPKPAEPPYEEAVIKSITISDKKGVVEAETITVKRY